MKFLRNFPNTATRDAVLASINYGVLSYTEGVGIKIKAEGDRPIDYSIPFYVENITNETNELSIYVSNGIEYSYDCEEWTYIADLLDLELDPGEKIYLRAEFYYDGIDNSIRGMSKIGGNIMSLIYADMFTGEERSFPTSEEYNYVFSNLFNNNDSLIDASELILPATTLTEGCYNSMFAECTSLTAAPALPATTLAEYCYSGMFQNCTSLTVAPALPATTLAEYCYSGMFGDCTSLTTAPALPATTLAEYCYSGMFGGCTSLTTAPALPATTLADFCCQAMFAECTSLTAAPALPAITMVSSCYYSMFRNCTSLERVAPFVATTLALYCYDAMYTGCESLIEKPVPEGYDYSSIYNYVDPS